MAGQPIQTGFASAGNANTLKGGQWQASTSGVPVPSLPAGTVPASGYFALGTHQVAQTPALQPNQNAGSVAVPSVSTTRQAPMSPVVMGNAGTNIGMMISKGAGGLGSLGARFAGLIKGGR